MRLAFLILVIYLAPYAEAVSIDLDFPKCR